MEKFIPAKFSSNETQVLKSRFIAECCCVYSPEEAKVFVDEVKKRYPNATHHVPVFIISDGNNIISHSSDDGEPSGTAGRPMLSVLLGSDFINICVVVTRYFGGVKLGTGGLTRAYSDCVKQLLLKVPKAILLKVTPFKSIMPYSFYDLFLSLCGRYSVTDPSCVFGADIECSFIIASAKAFDFEQELTALSCGQVGIIPDGPERETAFPLSDAQD